MNPQLQQGQQLQPAAGSTSPQGVSSVAPIAQPITPKLPTAQAPAPVAPLQSTSFNPTAGLSTIADFYKIPQQAALNVAQTQATGTRAGQQFAGQQFEAGVKEQNLKSQLDPSKYTVLNDPKGQYGLHITNSQGQPVDFATYINLTGQDPAQALAKSTDPKAQQFVSAYTNLQDLMRTTLAASGGDEQAKIKLADYYKANPGLEGMKPQQVSDLFMKQYGQFFGQPQQQGQGAQGVTSAFTGTNSPAASSPYQEIQNYPNIAGANPIATQLLGGSGGSDVSSLLAQLQSQGG